MKSAARLCRDLCAAVLVLAGLDICAAAETGDADADLVRRGKYLATAGDCVACHTAPGGKPMAGGLSLGTPLGPVVSTNITPSKTHGIGNYSLEQFTVALRKGIRADGQRLYPAMPYTSYVLVSDDDARALYAYFMHGVERVDTAPANKTELPFPFNIRLSMAAWNLLFLEREQFQPDPGKTPQWNRGAYLVRGLAHCSACHSPRNMLMAERASHELAGGDIGPWFAPNITSDKMSGIGGWSEKELVDYMRLGRARDKAQAAGPMVEAIDNSLKHLSEEDLRAMAAYLKSVPAQRDDSDTQPVYRWGAPVDELNSIRGMALPQDRNRMTGAQLYDAYCASCHQARGEGTADAGMPRLFHNTAVGRTNTNNLVMVILEGIQRQQDSSSVLMPGFERDLSDQQVATLGNYVMQRYGNPAARISVEQVKHLRTGGGSSSLLVLARLGIAVAAAAIVSLIVALVRRKRTSARSTAGKP